MVNHSIFGLFILEDWQIDTSPSDLFLSVPAQLPSLDFLHHGQTDDGNSICLPNQNSLPLRRENYHWRCLSVIVGNLVFYMPSSTSTQTLRMSVPPLSPAWLLALHPFSPPSSEASSSKPCIHSSMLYAAAGGLVCLHCSLGVHPGPPGPSSLFHNSICNGSMTFFEQFSPSFPPEPLFQPN